MGGDQGILMTTTVMTAVVVRTLKIVPVVITMLVSIGTPFGLITTLFLFLGDGQYWGYS